MTLSKLYKNLPHLYGSVLNNFLSFFIYLQEYQNFRIGNDGNLQGVGIFINAEPKTGHLVSDFFHFIFSCTLISQAAETQIY